MGMNRYYHYFVEGEDEEALLKALKTDMQVIMPGKIQVFNVVERRLTPTRLMSLKMDTTVVLVFDTDTGNTEILEENIRLLQKHGSVKEVLCIPQVENLEDELVRGCNIRDIRELTGSKNSKEYKRDLIRIHNLAQVLQKHGFDFSKFWNQRPIHAYQGFKNDADKIKKSHS